MATNTLRTEIKSLLACILLEGETEPLEYIPETLQLQGEEILSELNILPPEFLEELVKEFRHARVK